MESIAWFLRYCMIFFKKLGKDSVSAYAAQAAFFMIMSLFPFAMLLITILRSLPFLPPEGQFTGQETSFLPTELAEFLESMLGEIVASSSSLAIISITAIAALWAAGKGIHALIRGLNAIYNAEETRNYFKLRLTSSIYTLVFLLFLVITLVLWAFGNGIHNWIVVTLPELQKITLPIISFRTVIGLVLLVFFFLAIYKIFPNRKSTFLHELPGALLSSIGWIGFSLLYSFYMDHFAHYANLYGSLTAIVLLMLWLYFCMYILFLGAEVNLLYQNSPWMRRLDWKLARRKQARKAAKKAKKAAKGK